MNQGWWAAVGRQWSTSCPHCRRLTTHLHFFTSVQLPVWLIHVLGRDVYSELDPDISSLASHRKGHFTDFVLQKPGPCQTSQGWCFKHAPLHSVSLRSAKRGNTAVVAAVVVSFPPLPKFSAIPNTSSLFASQGNGPPCHHAINLSSNKHASEPHRTVSWRERAVYARADLLALWCIYSCIAFLSS